MHVVIIDHRHLGRRVHLRQPVAELVVRVVEVVLRRRAVQNARLADQPLAIVVGESHDRAVVRVQPLRARRDGVVEVPGVLITLQQGFTARFVADFLDAVDV